LQKTYKMTPRAFSQVISTSSTTQGRQGRGNVVKDPGPPLGLGLDRLPPLAHPACSPRVGLPEHVRMPADELRVHGIRNRVEIAVPLLLEQEREEDNLEEEVAELVVELRGIVRERRVGHLVRLLDGVRDDRASSLLAIPGTLGAQAPGQLAERVEGRHRATGPSSSLPRRPSTYREARSRRRS
jgi:hypothetical protein